MFHKFLLEEQISQMFTKENILHKIEDFIPEELQPPYEQYIGNY
jgi:hypothetical protein